MADGRTKRARSSSSRYDPSASRVEQNIAKYGGLTAQLLKQFEKHALRRHSCSKQLKVHSTNHNELSEWVAALPRLDKTPGDFTVHNVSTIDPTLKELNAQLCKLFPAVAHLIVHGNAQSPTTGCTVTKLVPGEVRQGPAAWLGLWEVQIVLNTWWWDDNVNAL
eukprot:TRINITY_DN71443_c0_g1_i1.p1 TRINITY_DN71443_c0_g1~~TRINITY_DN71443_c0_g1_i1.p1  ORF type:complete len:164 (+),score=25.99 TRINITY_DN71443_c0_g1_i1:26-517(+)